MTSSPWDDHVKIAIRSWARIRAKEVTGEAQRIPLLDMEYWLAELLTDALLTFNNDYNRAYNEHVHRLERLVEDAQNCSLPRPILIKKE